MSACTIVGCGSPLTEPWRSRGHGWLCEVHYQAGVTGEIPIAQIPPNSSPLVEFFERESSKTVTSMALPRELLYRREFMGEWHVPETNPGLCQTCGASVDDRVTYLPTGDQPTHYCFPCAELRPWETARWHLPGVVGVDRGMPIYDFPCSCGRPIRGTDRDRGKQCTHTDAAVCPGCGRLAFFTSNDCLEHHYHQDRTTCAWSGRQRAVVEHEQRRMASPPKSPTIREWLGERVSELGRWAEVLREQPVPAGLFLRFEWTGSEWRGFARRGSNAITRADVLASIGAREETAPEAWLEAVQMACFTRHPDVKPESKLAAFPWDPYPEVV